MKEPTPTVSTLRKRIGDLGLRAGPRWLVALAGEVFGLWPVQDRGAGNVSRMRFLFDRTRSPHPLFDPFYYTRPGGGITLGASAPLLHFLTRGGFNRRSPHPLFDPHWYLTVHPDVARQRINPLQHYVNYGWREGRSPHPLFSPKWYRRRYPETGSSDPLLHFLSSGGAAGLQPHPLFDSDWYLRTYPEVRRSGMNPLLHYLLQGAAEGKNPSGQFDSRRYLQAHPEAAAAGMDPLSHLVYSRLGSMQTELSSTPPSLPPLTLSKHASKRLRAAPPWRNAVPVTECPVFVVYGQPNIEFIESHLLPALAAQEGSFRLHLHLLHYKNADCLLSPGALAYRGGNLHGITDWSEGRPSRHIGFGEAVNYLFDRVRPENCFLIVNPDSMPMDGCIAQMLATFSQKPAALVEARQWPMEHPKEFDPVTGQTPWASGAFLLVASEAFRKLGGFDPIYFLYNEDVDLSWRAWLAGMPVVYEPRAMCAHFTGALTRDLNRFRREQFFTIRNFLLIAYKFFGARGERLAEKWIRQALLPEPFYQAIKQSYLELRGNVQTVNRRHVYHPDKIKILGMNLYHELRDC